MPEKEKPIYDEIFKRIRRKHGGRGIRVLIAFAALQIVILVPSFVFLPDPWRAYVVAGPILLLVFSPFLIGYLLDAFAFLSPKRHAAWKAGMRSKAYRLPELRGKYETRRHFLALDPYEFEEAVGEVYQKYGYKVTLTQKSGDRGVDLLMEDKDGRTYAVQVKQHKGSIGTPTLQRLQGALLHARADVPIIVTLSYFTEPARLYAQQHGIRLVDGDLLISMYTAAMEGPGAPAEDWQ